MDDFRNLEYRFQDKIKKHVILALPALHDLYGDIQISNEYEDSVLSFDMTYKIDFTISVRIRKYNYLKFNDLTIRCKSINGGKTEIDKILEGKAQMYFYAYMNKEETDLIKIRMADVRSIRLLYKCNRYTHQTNNDGTEFVAFLFSDIASNMGAIYQFDLP
jgi:hypothetical protein